MKLVILELIIKIMKKIIIIDEKIFRFYALYIYNTFKNCLFNKIIF